MKKEPLELIKSFGLKSPASGGAEITPEILEKVNKFALKPLTAEEVYVRKYLMAHNCVDRDNERFNEKILDDFAVTFPGKSFLIGHNRGGPGNGLYFDSSTEEMTPEQFTALTGDTPRLPEGMERVKVTWAWVYMLKEFNQQMIANIDAGICRHASIGFKAADITPIKGAYDNILFWEYGPPGEALEGSIVWLGAQPGATAQKRHSRGSALGGGNPDLDNKGAVSFSPTTPADEGRPWDAAGAKSRLAKWASSDGSGDKDKIDWGKYRKGFVWYDAENPENIGSYKLPHHDVIDGEISVVWAGVSAAMGALMGARGGVDVPADDMDPCYSHLAKHYKQYDKEPPEKQLDGDSSVIPAEAGIQSNKNKGGSMKDLIERLKKTFNRTFSEDGIADEIKAMLDEKDTAISEKEKRIGELTPLAEDGKKWRDDLLKKYVASKAKLAEVAETPEAQEGLKKVAETYPIEFLISECKHLEVRVAEKFPDTPQTKGDDRTDKTKDGGEKDYSKDNPLTPKKEGK